MRKPDFCICENEDADQLRGNLCFNGALLTVYLYLLTPNATFQKAGTCLDAQQRLCELSQSHVRKKREREFRINLKALEETSMFFGEQRILINSSFLFEFLPLSGFWIPLFMLSFQVSFDAGFSAFSWLISRFYYWIRRNLPVGRHFGYCFQLRPCF